jgi:hypothetical protein
MFPLMTRFAHLTVVLAERDKKAGRRAGQAAAKGRRARVEASRKAQEKTQAPAAGQENA